MSTILDPSNEQRPVSRQLAERAENITGRLALLNIAKPRGDILLDQFEIMLAEQLPNVSITRYTKPTFTKPAPESLRQEIRQNNDFVIEALAD